MLAPIIIFVYNRPEHTVKTIESLSKNYMAKESEVYIFSDSAKNDNSVSTVMLVREYIDSLQYKSYFKSVHIEKNLSNKGLANSVIQGVSDIIKKFGKVIVVEDDLVSNINFISFMNGALDYYCNDNRIWSISGYNLPIIIPQDYKEDVYLSYRGCSWGWATWVDRWEKVDWNVVDYKEFKKSKKLRSKINRGGRDMANMLDMQMEGKIDSWAIRWCYCQSKLDMFTVYPVVTKIKNIGLDGSGTHGGITDHFESSWNLNDSNPTFSRIAPNKQLLSESKDYFLTEYYYQIGNIKKILKSLLFRK